MTEDCHERINLYMASGGQSRHVWLGPAMAFFSLLKCCSPFHGSQHCPRSNRLGSPFPEPFCGWVESFKDQIILSSYRYHNGDELIDVG